MAAILFGLTPALQIARQRHRATITRQILVGAQVAASCVLLIVAGLLVRALDHAMSTHPGFEYRASDFDRSPSRHPRLLTGESARLSRHTPEPSPRFPGVESVSLALTSPSRPWIDNARIEIDGRGVNIQINHVDPNSFRR